MGISRGCASKWGTRWRRYGDAGLLDRSSSSRQSPNATPARAIEKIEFCPARARAVGPAHHRRARAHGQPPRRHPAFEWARPEGSGSSILAETTTASPGRSLFADPGTGAPGRGEGRPKPWPWRMAHPRS
ncbi:leucine zipper domain-containing protein [Saccharopolyspora sp. MS10]|uniref:leucine zipper domain-containing protein n=1 Tax=Saccharopolyspora sp. MS10 TaxID=3385973 RepID=UPI00399F93E1